MALTSTQRSICNKISDDFEALVEPARKVVRDTKRKIAEIKTQLNNLKTIGFSPSQDIADAVDDMEQNVNDEIPNVDQEAIDEINNIISSCTYLNEDELLKNPTAILKSMTKSTFDAVQSVVEAVPLPDFQAGRLIDQLENIVANQIPDNPDDLGISKGLQKADQLINCLTSICGSEFATKAQQYADEVESLYDDLNIVGDAASADYGKFDKQAIYDAVGLDPSEIVKMDDIVNSVQDVKNTASNNLSEAVNTTKSLRKSALSIL